MKLPFVFNTLINGHCAKWRWQVHTMQEVGCQTPWGPTSRLNLPWDEHQEHYIMDEINEAISGETCEWIHKYTYISSYYSSGSLLMNLLSIYTELICKHNIPLSHYEYILYLAKLKTLWSHTNQWAYFSYFIIPIVDSIVFTPLLFIVIISVCLPIIYYLLFSDDYLLTSYLKKGVNTLCGHCEVNTALSSDLVMQVAAIIGKQSPSCNMSLRATCYIIILMLMRPQQGVCWETVRVRLTFPMWISSPLMCPWPRTESPPHLASKLLLIPILSPSWGKNSKGGNYWRI